MTIIKTINIEGLFCSKNIRASWEDKALILTGLPGSGKTTFLNLVHSILVRILGDNQVRFKPKVSFKKISIEFTSGYIFELTDKDLIGGTIFSERLFESAHKEMLRILGEPCLLRKNPQEPVSMYTNTIKLYRGSAEKVKQFQKLINDKYLHLSGKELFINQSYEFLFKTKDRTLTYGELSFSERKLIDLLEPLYLDSDTLVFIDSGIDSICLEWQKMVMQDLMQCENVIQILATTHSPFVFDDSKGLLEPLTKDMEDIIY
tara:strand:- start:1217 stop:1999 length:783 start_codon:yes stop_codon:yes gene_type:complete